MSTDVPSSLDVDQLPDDPALLKRIIAEQQAVHRAQLARVEIDQQAAIDSAVQQAVKAAVEATTAALLRRFYGPKNETFDPRQLLLFGERIDQLPLDEASLAEEAGEEVVTRRVKKRHQHGRNPLPEHLPRIEIEHDLPEIEKPCPHCGELRCRIGQEISEQLEYLPASFKVLRHIRPKYACRACDAAGESPHIVTAPKPTQPIEKGLAGPGLIAYVAVSKWGDHLPLYRLENIFARQQVHIARSTMCAWLAAGAKLLEPLLQRMIQRVKESRVIHTDDTRVPIQSPGEKKCRSGRLWTYIGDSEHPYIVFDYTPDRSRAGPAQWLGDYRGYLQADAYGAYDGIYAPGHVQEVACWAHARRKFVSVPRTTGSCLEPRSAGELVRRWRGRVRVSGGGEEIALPGGGEEIALPGVGEEAGEVVGRSGNDLSQQAGQIVLRIDAVALGAGDQRIPDGSCLPGGIVSGEQPILTTNGDTLQRAFRRVVVDIEEALRGVTTERLPLIARVRHRLTQRTTRQNLRARALLG